MSTLLLRLAGPMQSWGTQSRFTVRDTGLEPSKSGVIGLLCAALGRPRHQPVEDLSALRMGVRVDHEGTMRMDYHTAGGTHHRGDPYGVRRADDSGVGPVVSHRYYLADADFLIGLQGEDEALPRRLHNALREPVWHLFLGRKAFVPGVPVFIPDGFQVSMGLEEALTTYPWPRADLDVPEGPYEPLRFAVESTSEEGDVRMDQPYDLAYAHRRFSPRRVVAYFRTPGDEIPIRVT